MTWAIGYQPLSVLPTFQIPFFTAPYELVPGFGFAGRVEEARNGFVLARNYSIGTHPLYPFFEDVIVPAAPYTITQVRVYFARTGDVPDGVSLKVAFWYPHRLFTVPAVDLSTISPAAVATIPLVTLPLADAADNYQCAPLPDPTVGDLSVPISLPDDQFVSVAVYLDNSFTPVSNVVIGAIGLIKIMSINNNLDFSTYTNDHDINWLDLPSENDCSANFGNKGMPLELNVTPSGGPGVGHVYGMVNFMAVEQPGGTIRRVPNSRVQVVS